jgi:regulator of protease activity HflC (stomatin/prohibitin superfamily)
MTAGLGIDRLLDFLFSLLYLFKCWYVVNPYSEIIILTLGKTRRKKPVKGPGIHFILPFELEEVLEDNVVPTDLGCRAVAMTLKDGTQLYIEISGRWKIIDMIKFNLENEDADSLIENVAGMAQEYLYQFTWDELMEVGMRGRGGLTSKLRTYCNQELREWGAELDRLYIYQFIRTSLKDGVVKIL